MKAVVRLALGVGPLVLTRVRQDVARFGLLSVDFDAVTLLLDKHDDEGPSVESRCRHSAPRLELLSRLFRQ